MGLHMNGKHRILWFMHDESMHNEHILPHIIYEFLQLLESLYIYIRDYSI